MASFKSQGSIPGTNQNMVVSISCFVVVVVVSTQDPKQTVRRINGFCFFLLFVPQIFHYNLISSVNLAIICHFFILKFLGCQAKLLLKGFWELQSRKIHVRVSLFKPKFNKNVNKVFPRWVAFLLMFFLLAAQLCFCRLVRYSM